jgi:hypothetical protein
MFQINMTTHGNCAMVFIIHKQTFSTLGKTLICLFLLHIVAQNASHSLRFSNIHNNIKVVKFKEPQRTCWSLPCALEPLVEFKLEKQLFLSHNNFSFKKFQVIFIELFINN